MWRNLKRRKTAPFSGGLFFAIKKNYLNKSTDSIESLWYTIFRIKARRD